MRSNNSQEIIVYLKQKLYNIGNILPRATPTYLHIYVYLSTTLISHVVERPLRERLVVGSNPGNAIPKALKMVLAAPLLALHLRGIARKMK